MPRLKYSAEEKIKAIERYLRGVASAAEIAAEIGITQNGESYIREWSAAYRENGIEGFHLTKGNRSYGSEVKQRAVEDYLQGKSSVRGICRKFKIPSTRTLRRWIQMYNSNRELRDYNSS